METIIIGALGGAAYALQGIFKNKTELSNKFKLEPYQALSSVVVGGIIGAGVVYTGLPEAQVVTLVLAVGINKGVKALLKLVGGKFKQLFNW